MSIYVNHLGFVPSAAKHFLVGGHTEVPFIVRDQRTSIVSAEGILRSVPSDFGTYSRGDFHALAQPGMYRIEAGGERSEIFAINPEVYDPTIQAIVGYFTLQRCGNTNRNWLGQPCHLDDGIRGDNRSHLDVFGGWHDACDIRKWVNATIFGLLGLLRLKTVLNPVWDTGQIEDELRWGNRYFLNMQDNAGFVMNYCGGDFFVHADGNRWSDNVSDGKDDRVIDVRPSDSTAQWMFVLTQAGMARLTAAGDPQYAHTCRKAALRCFNWLLAEDRTRTAGELGIALCALAELHQLDGQRAYIEQAVGYASRLMSLQVKRQEDVHRLPVWGFFWNRWEPADSPMALDPYRSIWQGNWPLIGLGDLLSWQPNHTEANRWREAISLYSQSYLQTMTQRNAFGIVPYGLYRSNPGGGRPMRKFWYRWFYEANPGWCVGINANLASTGVGLLRAAKLLNKPDWAGLAQRQLDWILGANPFNASTVMGSGYNNPQHMFGGEEFRPQTPFLPGGVMNGISGDADDFPRLRPGSYEECEYWTPMVAFTMWLLAETQRG